MSVGLHILMYRGAQYLSTCTVFLQLPALQEKNIARLTVHYTKKAFILKSDRPYSTKWSSQEKNQSQLTVLLQSCCVLTIKMVKRQRALHQRPWSDLTIACVCLSSCAKSNQTSPLPAKPEKIHNRKQQYIDL